MNLRLAVPQRLLPIGALLPRTNPHGVTGFRCRTLKEFMDAAENVKQLDRAAIRERAVSLYNLDTIGAQYNDYFQRLLTLWGDGWYELGE